MVYKQSDKYFLLFFLLHQSKIFIKTQETVRIRYHSENEKHLNSVALPSNRIHLHQRNENINYYCIDYKLRNKESDTKNDTMSRKGMKKLIEMI